jgi:hypothetical protein
MTTSVDNVVDEEETLALEPNHTNCHEAL